jgi:hypothetical protein
MSREEEAVLIERLLDLLPRIYLPLRAYPVIEYSAKRAQGKLNKNTGQRAIWVGKTLKLSTVHFSTLSLIAQLQKKEGKCERPRLKKLFLWKWSGYRENTFEESILDHLLAAQLIKQMVNKDRQKEKLVTLTREGEKLLQTLKALREDDMKLIVSNLNLKSREEYETLIAKLEEFAERIWGAVKERAENPHSPEFEIIY